MRILPLALTTAVLLATASPVRASDHLTRINEILLSAGGDDAVQYVELVGPGELFPQAYELGVYDADGVSLGKVPLAIDSDATRHYVATGAADAAFGPNGDDELTVSLPANGQVCFERKTG